MVKAKHRISRLAPCGEAVKRSWRSGSQSALALCRVSAGGALLIVGSMTASAFAADDAARMAQGKQLFTQGAKPPCALCHTLADAGSEGEIGPVLDDLKPDAERVASALRTGLGAMPSFSETLTEEQIETLAYYVSHASGGAK